ncbi:hypothetical protein [Muricoccus aerilatus]|uniref:hypothetical protein n=1 Tax=Muricoccus aerilatus TaxID=452982 RepID=UPI0012EB9F6C|nr:hypothetical protein [Roseomonas aerilata]
MSQRDNDPQRSIAAQVARAADDLFPRDKVALLRTARALRAAAEADLPSPPARGDNTSAKLYGR